MNDSSPQNLTLLQDISQSISEWSLWKLALCIFLTLVCLTTILGNALVLYVFAKSKRALRSPVHILLANLAFADFLVGSMVMPILISVTVFDFKWYWGDLLCQLSDYLHFCLCATSMLSMVAVCLERFVGVKYPMHHKRILTKKRVRGISAALWLAALVLTATPLTVWPLKGSTSPFTCAMNLRHDFIFFISVSLYWIPIGIIFYIYWLIYKTSNIPSAELMKWAKKSLGSTVVSNVSSISSSRRRPSKSDEEKFEKARLRQARLTKKMTKLVGVMLFFYAPLFLLFLLRGFKAPWFSLDVLLALAWLRYFTSCSNTFLYIHVVPYYKKQLLRLLSNESSSNGGHGQGSEATSAGVSNSSDSFSSSCERSTGDTFLVVNSVPLVSSDNLKNEHKDVGGVNIIDVEMGTEKKKSIPNTSFAEGPSSRDFIQEMDDILAKIEKELEI